MIQPQIQDKIDRLQEYANKLKVYLFLTDEELLHNEDKRLAAERLFQLMVDEAIDINGALAYQLDGHIPESYKSSFYELVPLGIISDDFVKQIIESVKIRNQMTHDYEKIQHKDLVVLMKKYFPLYQEYARILVEKFVPDVGEQRIN